MLNCFQKKLKQLYKEISRDTDTGIFGAKCIQSQTRLAVLFYPSFTQEVRPGAKYMHI